MVSVQLKAFFMWFSVHTSLVQSCSIMLCYINTLGYVTLCHSILLHYFSGIDITLQIDVTLQEFNVINTNAIYQHNICCVTSIYTMSIYFIVCYFMSMQFTLHYVSWMQFTLCSGNLITQSTSMQFPLCYKFTLSYIMLAAYNNQKWVTWCPVIKDRK